jgi:hypothetical protein
MSISARWVKEAKGRYSENSSKEDESYRAFLNDHKNNEKKREEARKTRGKLSADWKPNDLAGMRVLVVGENGVGDEILTAGCLSQLTQECRQVIWRCDRKLQSLFRRSFPGIEFVSQGDTEPTVDGTIYSWELISRFRRDLNGFGWLTNGDFAPYIRPSQALKDSLRERYSDGSRKLVGLAWRSERDGKEISDKACDLRDVPYWGEFFACLGNKVRFVSLQYGDTQDEIAFVRWRYGIEIYQDGRLDIFGHAHAAAAQIATMDYVISISTAAAHFAGSMGVPSWVLLQKKPFAHWRAGKEICPWYPTLRPVKQEVAGNWQDAIETVTKELCHEIENGPR